MQYDVGMRYESLQKKNLFSLILRNFEILFLLPSNETLNNKSK